MKTQLENRLARIRDLYTWQHISRDEYLGEYDEVQRKLRELEPEEDSTLDNLAGLMKDAAMAWKQGNQETRNRLANTLFERIIINGNRVVGIMPRQELESFFRLSYEEHQKSLSGDPEGIRTPDLQRDRLAC